MFLQNKYSKCYYSIIDRAKARVLNKTVYVEKHHIIPKSLGGSDDKSNIAILTGREHFLCHRLLTKMTSGNSKRKMVSAIWYMCRANKTRRAHLKVTARIYETIKSEVRTNRTAADFTPEWKQKISESKKGKTAWNKGIPRPDSVRQSISAANKGKTAWNKGVPCNPETARKSSETQKGKIWVHTVTERKCVRPEELSTYLNNGWIKGVGPRKPRS